MAISHAEQGSCGTFQPLLRALGGAALPNRTAYVNGDCSAVALWLAPDVGPDEEGLTKIIEENGAPERQADMAGVMEQMMHYHRKSRIGICSVYRRRADAAE